MAKDIIHAGISHLYAAGQTVRRLARRVAGRPARAELSILLYHGVADDERDRFVRHIDALAKRAHVVDLLAPRVALRPGLNVGLTFDDALETSFRNGVEPLLERRLPCAVFVPSGCLGKAPSWLSGTDDPARHDRVLTAAELRAYAARGVGLGSHTETHPRLSRLSTAELSRELAGSRISLEQDLGLDIRTLAFPYGDFDARVLQACRESGYTRVFSSIPEASTEVEPGFHFARVNAVPAEPVARVLLKCAGAYGWMGTAVRAKRALRGRRASS